MNKINTPDFSNELTSIINLNKQIPARLLVKKIEGKGEMGFLVRKMPGSGNTALG